MTDWLLLHYKLPTKPSALRVYTWRKLKRLGAVLLHDAVWVLPDLPRTAEQVQWLTAEIEEMGGRPVFLELRVKVLKDWRNDENALRRLGYKISNKKKRK